MLQKRLILSLKAKVEINHTEQSCVVHVSYFIPTYMEDRLLEGEDFPFSGGKKSHLQFSKLLFNSGLSKKVFSMEECEKFHNRMRRSEMNLASAPCHQKYITVLG